jgi:hypothetical protein
MNKNVISFVVILALLILGILYWEKKEADNYVDFKNLNNTEIGEEFVAFIKQHRGQIKSLLLSNNFNLNSNWANTKEKAESDWLGIQVTAIIKKERIDSISGDVTITASHKFQNTDIVLPEFFSFYFRKLDNKWKLAIRDGYFVNPYEEKNSDGIELPPEIYAGISKIFPEQFTVNY